MFDKGQIKSIGRENALGYFHLQGAFHCMPNTRMLECLTSSSRKCNHRFKNRQQFLFGK